MQGFLSAGQRKATRTIRTEGISYPKTTNFISEREEFMENSTKTKLPWIIAGGTALLAMIWILFSHFIAPDIITTVYAGEGYSFLDRFFESKSLVALKYYHRLWADLRLKGLVFLLSVGGSISFTLFWKEFLLRSNEVDSVHRKFSIRTAATLLVGSALSAGCLGTLLWYLAQYFSNENLAAIILDETGIPQSATFGIYVCGVTIAATLAVFHPSIRLELGLVSFLALILAFREIDIYVLVCLFHPTTKWLKFFEGSSSLSMKILFPLILLGIIISVTVLIVRLSPFRGLLAREKWMIFALGFLFLMAISQFIEEIVPMGPGTVTEYVEELLEMLAASFAALAIYSLARQLLVGKEKHGALQPFSSS